ncbi:hypothetical protein M0R04_13395 [Candidatus Dojkabacteria bacterium]|jgi:hypothetical protein|nr:hypothetical protein [Candidatus Dojkabacteria bacterium]
MTKQLCPKCNKELHIETDESLAQEYKYFCINCQENFYSFEARQVKA